jgi:hypothetical protein
MAHPGGRQAGVKKEAGCNEKKEKSSERRSIHPVVSSKLTES